MWTWGARASAWGTGHWDLGARTVECGADREASANLPESEEGAWFPRDFTHNRRARAPLSFSRPNSKFLSLLTSPTCSIPGAFLPVVRFVGAPSRLFGGWRCNARLAPLHPAKVPLLLPRLCRRQRVLPRFAPVRGVVAAPAAPGPRFLPDTLVVVIPAEPLTPSRSAAAEALHAVPHGATTLACRSG
jgi:hypothetical protein